LAYSDTPSARSWACPPEQTDEKTKLGWITRSISQGESFLQSQQAFEDFDRAIEIIAGKMPNRPAKLSQLHLNRLKRQIREVVGTLSNLRPLWGYKSDNPLYDRHTEILNKLILGWWHTQFVDRAIRESLQYAAVLGTGYLSVAWERDLWNAGRGDVALKSHGPRDVLPIQLGSDMDIQRAYAVIIKTEVPLAQAHTMYPTMAHRINQDRESPSILQRAKETVSRYASPVLGLSNQSASNPDAHPTVDIFNIYIIDSSINDSGADIHMGDAGTNWDYSVPFVGKQVGTGMFDSNGQEILHTITPEEAALYPRRRLITCTRSCILKDGPSPWWHGKVPLVQFRLDDWPWQFLGFSLIREGASVQDSINSLIRSVVDAANVRLRPPYRYDRSMVSKGFVERFDPRQPGARVEVDSSIGVTDPVAPIFDPSQFDIPQIIPEFIQSLEDRMGYQIGVQDLTALAKAQQTPSADSIEKLMELAGPLVTDMSRNMERSLRDLGEMYKSMTFQFYTAARKVQILGPDGLTEEDFDFEPDSMVPSHFPWQDSTKPSGSPRHVRAQWHQNNFVFHVTPNSLHQITQMTRKLLFLQLQRSGVPIDPWTLAEVFDIPNFGKPPDGANTVVERWEAWQRIFAQIQASIQMQMQMMMMAQSPIGQALGAAQAGMGGGQDPNDPNAGSGGNPGPGRKPTGQQPPQLEQKGGNGTEPPRTTVTES
jgi:hypothetical protein